MRVSKYSPYAYAYNCMCIKEIGTLPNVDSVVDVISVTKISSRAKLQFSQVDIFVACLLTDIP